MSPSSQVEILILLILLQLKIIMEHGPFFLGNLFLISQDFLCEKGQYVLIVSVLVIVGLISCDLGTLSPCKKILCFLPFVEDKHFSCNPEFLVLQAVRHCWVCWRPGDIRQLPGDFVSASPLPCLTLGFWRSHHYLTGLEELRIGQDLVRGRLSDVTTCLQL